MGWLDDVGNALAYTTPAGYLLKEGLSRNNRPVNPEVGSGQTYIPYKTTAASGHGLGEKLFSSEKAREYGNVLDRKSVV